MAFWGVLKGFGGIVDLKILGERLKLVATALAGYASMPTGAPSSTLWQEMCKTLSTELQDPYLRSMFALIASSGDWNVVLQEEGLSIRDRVGVALRFLDDDAVCCGVLWDGQGGELTVAFI